MSAGDGRTKGLLLADRNTYGVAGDKIEALLHQNSIAVSKYIFPEEQQAVP
ncbi:MAG: hypothetical protein IKY33_00270 [Clostridia bacterium]|nr:hypothetical protein [Clostridia bacterium]